MKKVKNITPSHETQQFKPALTPEAQEAELISLATNLAREQLINGTASSQVITHYLKLGSSREQLEKETIAKQMELLDAKIESLQSAARIEELYKDAIQSMRVYSGRTKDEDV